MPYTKKELQAMLKAKRKEIADAIKSGRISVTIPNACKTPDSNAIKFTAEVVDKDGNIVNRVPTWSIGFEYVTEDAEFEVIKSEIKNKQS